MTQQEKCPFPLSADKLILIPLSVRNVPQTIQSGWLWWAEKSLPDKAAQQSN